MINGDAAVEKDLFEVVALGGNDGPGGWVGIKVVRVITGHSSQLADRIGRKNVLVGDAPHGFKVVAGLELPPRNENAIVWLLAGGNRRAASVVICVRQIVSVLLHQFVGDRVARKFVADDHRETVFGRELALIAERKIAYGAVVGVILRDDRVEIVVRHVS